MFIHLIALTQNALLPREYFKILHTYNEQYGEAFSWELPPI